MRLNNQMVSVGGANWGDAGISRSVASVRRRGLPTLIVPVLGSAVITAAAAASTPPVATMSYQIDSGPPVAIAHPGLVLQSGNALFNKTVQAGPVKIIYNYNADLNPVGIVSFNGTMTIENNSTDTIHFNGSFTVPICPKINGSATTGGTSTIKLTTNSDGGALSCDTSDPWLFAATANGEFAKKLFFCPFTMGKTGSGSTTTNLTWGTPIPSAPGPQYINTIGHDVHFSLTPGDKVVLTLIFAAAGPIDDPLSDPCPGDVDGNNVIDKDDLLLVLLTFGQTADCGNEVDTNGDGFIDGADLAQILSYWGNCPTG